MKKQKFFLLSLILALSLLFTYSCSKRPFNEEKNETDKLEKRIGKEDSIVGNTVNRIPGACPFPCGDTRCDDYQEPPPGCSGGGGGTDPLAIVKNSNNQYDKAGELHNALLAYFIINSDLPVSNAYEIIYSFDNYFQSSGIDSLASKAVLGATQIAFATAFENASNKYTFLIQGNYMSQQGVSYYQKLDSAYETAGTITTFYSLVKTVESQIISSSSLPLNEKQILLEAASVGRFSAYYWDNPNNLTLWGVGTIVSKNTFSWKSLGKADLKGGIEGGVAGALVGGSVATPVGAVPGWIVGAVSWGAGCSASNAIGQVTGWW